VAFDTPGYGMSDPPPGPLSIEAYAAAFEDGLEALGMEGPLDVYGFHTGTFLAAELALANPARIGRLALTGIPSRTPQERAERLAACRATPGPTDDGEGIFERLRGVWDVTVTQRHPGVPIERAAAMFADRAKPLHRYWWAYNGVWSYEPEKRLPLVRQQVLLAQPDELIKPQSLAAVKLFPNATVTLLPDLSRDIFEPGAGLPQLVAALRDFLV
jgi:pimeloyl-ACP methyl ester carboxylesterase